jgi:3-oxoacyl-[acyl-carrier-protein] synthase III
MPGAKIVDVVNFMPERIIDNASFFGQDDDPLAENPFFKGVKQRRFASPDYLSEDLGAKALELLIKKTDTDPHDIDLIICSCIFSDTYWPGIGPAVQHRVKADRATILNIDTSCSSYLSALKIAQAYIESGIYKKIAIITVTNFISRLPEFQKSRRSSVLGDGATATLIVAGESSIVTSYERSHGEYYGLFRFEPDFVEGRFLNYWERGCGPITVNFEQDMVEAIRRNAVELVPNAVKQCLLQADLTAADISLLITHQPNTMFLKEWRSSVGVNDNQTHDTLECYGNLFQGSIPVTLADALEKKMIKPKDLIACGTFSNGGDFVSAMLLRWNG